MYAYNEVRIPLKGPLAFHALATKTHTGTLLVYFVAILALFPCMVFLISYISIHVNIIQHSARGLLNRCHLGVGTHHWS